MSQLLAAHDVVHTTPESAPDAPGAPSVYRSLAGVVVVAVAVVAALPFSLTALFEDYQHGAVLGELVLVPGCALALALVAASRHRWVVCLRPGRADYAVAGAAGSAALALLAWGPLATGNHYYALRPDLLALPFVAVAAISLVFGIRAMVAFVAPLAVLFLAWPLPWRAVAEPVSAVVASVTSGTVRMLLEVAPLATVVPGPGDLRLTVPGPDGPFDVLVASACSGMSGIVGMLLIGLCAQYVLHGPLGSRARWLAAALAMAWILNVVRILALLGLGALGGSHLALDVFHPLAGLLLLNVALAVLLVAARRFGLELDLRRPAPYDTPLTSSEALEERMSWIDRGRRGLALACGVAVVAAAGAAIPVSAVAYEAGAPAVTAFADSPDLGPRFAVDDGTEKAWARSYFGTDSTWMRYRARPASAMVGYTVWVDSVVTSDWSGLRAHPLLDCYSFHGFELVTTGRPTLAAGILADEVVYRRADGATWHVLGWEWPVRRGDGSLAHERVTLLASSTDTAVADEVAAPEESGGLRGVLAQRLARGGSGSDPNPGLTRVLRADASEAIARHVHSTDDVLASSGAEVVR